MFTWQISWLDEVVFVAELNCCCVFLFNSFRLHLVDSWLDEAVFVAKLKCTTHLPRKRTNQGTAQGRDAFATQTHKRHAMRTADGDLSMRSMTNMKTL